MIAVVGKDSAGVSQRLYYSDFYDAAHAAFNTHKTWIDLHIQHTTNGVLYCTKRSDESECSILRVCNSCAQPQEEFTVAADKARKKQKESLLVKHNREAGEKVAVQQNAVSALSKPQVDTTPAPGDGAQRAAILEKARLDAERDAALQSAAAKAADYQGEKLTFTDARRFALIGVPELSVDYSVEEQDQIQKVNETLPLVEQCTKTKYVLVSNGSLLLKLKPEQIDEKAWKVLETDPKNNPHFGLSKDARIMLRRIGAEWVQVACPLLGAAVDVELKPAGFGEKMPSVQLFTYETPPGRRFYIQARMVELVRKFHPKALTKTSPIGRTPDSLFPEPFGVKGKNEPMIPSLAFVSAKTGQVLALVMPTSHWY